MFHEGQKVVCVDDSAWALITHHGPNPARHNIYTISATNYIFGQLWLLLSGFEISEFSGGNRWFTACDFRPLESWPDLQQSAVEETVAGIHELQPA